MNCRQSSRAVLLCVLSWVPFSAPAIAQLQVGAALRVITPDPLLPITGGMGPTAPAKEQKGELTVRAITIGTDELRMAIVSVDALGFPSVLADRARAKINGIPAEFVLIGATHTHRRQIVMLFPTVAVDTRAISNTWTSSANGSPKP